MDTASIEFTQDVQMLGCHAHNSFVRSVAPGSAGQLTHCSIRCK